MGGYDHDAWTGELGTRETMLSAYRLAAVSSAFLNVSLFLAGAYILLSSPARLRSPVFGIHMAAFACTIVYFVLKLVFGYLEIRERLARQPDGTFDASLNRSLAQLDVVNSFLSLFAPLVAESSLLFKLAAFYPAWSNRPLKRVLVLGPFALALLLRFVASLLAIWHGVHFYLLPVERKGSSFYLSGPYGLAIIRFVDAFLQLASCLYASGLMLRRAYLCSRNVARQGRHGRAVDAPLWRHLRFFIESILMSFVPPLICQIIIVASAFTPTVAAARANTYGILFNVVMALCFSILATTWSSIRDATPSQISSSSSSSSSRRHISTSTSLRPSSRDRPPPPPAESKSIIAAVLDRAGITSREGAESEEEMEVVQSITSTSSGGEGEGHVPRFPHKGTSEWRRSTAAAPRLRDYSL